VLKIAFVGELIGKAVAGLLYLSGWNEEELTWLIKLLFKLFFPLKSIRVIFINYKIESISSPDLVDL